MKELLRTITPFFSGHTHTGRSRIYRHWELLLLAAVVVNTSILLFSFYLFLQINEGDIFRVEPEDQVSLDTIDRNKLQQTLGSFEEREALFESRKSSRLSIPNPAL